MNLLFGKPYNDGYKKTLLSNDRGQKSELFISSLKAYKCFIPVELGMRDTQHNETIIKKTLNNPLIV